MDHDLVSLRQDFSTMKAEQGALSRQMSGVVTAIDNLTKQVADSKQTQWPVLISLLSLIIVVMSGLGFLAFQPLREKQVEMYGDMKYVSREQMVPRGELQEKWRGTEKDIDNVRQRIASEAGQIQRQVDELRNQYNSTYGARVVPQFEI